MADFNWTCPHCGHDVTISDRRCSTSYHTLYIDNADGRRTLSSQYIVCPNQKCRKFSLRIWLHESVIENNQEKLKRLVKTLSLIPPSKAQQFPDYVPLAIREDYEEACAIVELSPKASATLARRALQGIIRDFWGVVKKRLVDEIDGIKDKVDPLTWDAIDAVRRVANIGAHMEQDINVMIDVEPNEANLLIGLIETLIKDSYIAREKRKAHLAEIVALGKAKDAEKNSAS
jgi:hypothetical protein